MANINLLKYLYSVNSGYVGKNLQQLFTYPTWKI